VSGVEPDVGRPSESGLVLAHKAGAVVLGRIAAAAGEVVLPILLVHVLDKMSVAVLAYLLLLYGTVATIAATGLPESVLYFLVGLSSGERRSTVRRIGLALGGIGLLAASGFFVYWLVGLWTEGNTGTVGYLPWLIPYVLADLPVRLMPHLLVAENRHRQAAWWSMGDSGAQLVAVLVPAAVGMPLWVPLAALTGLSFGKLAVLVAAVRRFYPRGSAGKAASPVSLRAIFRYALPLGFSEIASILNQRFDRFLVMAAFAEEEFAEYFVGAWQIPMITIIPFAVGNVLMPRLAGLYRDGRSADALALWRTSIEKVSLIVLPFAFVFLVAAEETIALLFGADYAGAAPVFRIYTLVMLGRVAAYGNMLAAAGRTRAVLVGSTAGLAANVLISVPLVYLVGFTGAAWGTVLAFVVIVACYLREVASACGVSVAQAFPWAAWAKALLLGGVASAPALAFKFLVPVSPGVALAVEAAIVLVVFGTLGTAVGLIRRADWAYIRDWLSLRGMRGAEGRGT
jgi:O-antigen/teichoic acid export membrane protein